MCRLYEVTRGGYYAWRQRCPSARSEENQRLLKRIERVHAQSHETYGSPRIQRALCVQGVRVGRNRVARLMRKHQIRARAARLYRPNAYVRPSQVAMPFAPSHSRATTSSVSRSRMIGQGRLIRRCHEAGMQPNTAGARPTECALCRCSCGSRRGGIAPASGRASPGTRT